MSTVLTHVSKTCIDIGLNHTRQGNRGWAVCAGELNMLFERHLRKVVSLFGTAI